MRHAYGFTLIEVLITITVMVVLLILAVVSLGGTEARARDEERVTDMTILSQQLDNFYTTGSDTSTTVGRYPGTQDIDTEAELLALLRNIDPKILRAPTVQTSDAMSLVVATSNSKTTPIASTITTSTYIYQPLTSSGALCTSMITGQCRKFNLYYMLENNTVLQIRASKYQ